MATLYTQQDKNVKKTWVLMGVFIAFFIGIGYVLSDVFQQPLVFPLVIIISILMNIVGYWKSDTIALRIAHAVPADPAIYRDLHNSVENLAITAGLPKPRVYIIPDSSMNAFATGRNAQHAAIAVTEGLLRGLEKNELEGVLAHEMAHIGNNDILLQSVVAIIVGAMAMLAEFALRGSALSSRDENRVGGLIAILGIIFIILSPIIATFIQLSISRKREYLADATGALLTRYPQGLANALRKISAQGKPLQQASDATAHMYISNPFGKKATVGIHALFSTHPPVEKRIEALEKLSV